jgi:hypothetical protein
MQNDSVTNTAWASVGGINSEPQSETIFKEPIPPPILTLKKSAKPDTYQEPGETISYSYWVANEGPVPLKGPVTVEDDHQTETVSCQNPDRIGDLDTVLDPDEWLICNSTYTITDTDLDNGSVTNIAVARAGGVSSSPSSETIYARALTLTKSADRETYEKAGDRVNYTYVVTSKSKLPLNGPVTVEDDRLDVACPDVSSVGNNDGFLDWDETITCTRSYTVTQDDMDIIQPDSDRGSVTNTAVARAGDVNSNRETLTLWAEPSPQLSLTNTANPEKYDTVGQTITYAYVVKNEGNVTLFSPFKITDDHFEVRQPFDCETEKQRLAPGESATCSNSKTYPISQPDFNFGNSFVTTNATASGRYGEETIISPIMTTSITCSYSREGWPYDVEEGVSLRQISEWYYIAEGKTIEEMIVVLQKANCMGLLEKPEEIQGNTLYVPGPPPLATISGFIYDIQVQPLGGILVQLMSNGIIIDSTTTAANGRYELSARGPGDYQIFRVPVTLRRGNNLPKDFYIIPATQ